jgi:hypothetical protein
VDSAQLERALVNALQAEANDALAVAPYLDLVDLAAANPSTPGSLAAALAALDALVFRGVNGLDPAPSALAMRSRETLVQVVARLRAAWAMGVDARGGDSAFLRGRIAQALHELALFSGEPAGAKTWRERSGCAEEAAVIGPLDAAPLRSLDEPSVVSPTGAFAANFPGVAPFAPTLSPTRVLADACRIDVNATSTLQGLRAVVVDLDSSHAQRTSFALTSSSAAVLAVGGVRAIERPFALGGNPVTRFATVELPKGRVRVVVNVAQRGDGGVIELAAWGDDGRRLRMIAPRLGDVATGRGGRAVEVSMNTAPAAGHGLVAAALLALGDSRAAEHRLESASAPLTTAEQLLLVRAMDAAADLPEAQRAERTEAVLRAVLSAWPASWEAKLGLARLMERSRGPGEGVILALRGLGVRPGVGSVDALHDRMALAGVALLAQKAQLLDVAESAFSALAREAPGAALVAGVDAKIHRRSGDQGARAACAGGQDRAGGACLGALRTKGDYVGALAELGRLRALRGSPDALQVDELSLHVARGDMGRALAVYDSMLPGQRELAMMLGYAIGHGKMDEARARLARDGSSASDTPFVAGALQAVLRQHDPAAPFEALGERLVRADRAQPFLPGAATAVLSHIERYSIAANGLVSFVFYDLRRVSGTTDVESGAQAYGPRIDGRSAPRLLRRRIHKKDGRVLEPDAAQMAAQDSELSQLEQGDYVEQIIDGLALPGDTGQLVLDTPDLLPERTSVHSAEIEIRRPASVAFSMWAHPLLGKPVTRTEGLDVVSSFKLENAAPRRIEDGVPAMERSVSVSLGTLTWSALSRAVDDNLRSFDERDPFVTRFALEAAGADEAPSLSLVERIVAATGKRVSIATGGELSDVAAIYGGGSQTASARATLELGQGSRSWVIVRALRELGMAADVALAETEPWSTSPDFPPHAGRFRRPLVVAPLATGDVWIDADVEGPPLPPGQVSPELRGRNAMLPGGRIVAVGGADAGQGDVIDVRLTLDERGDARGTLTVLLHGRPAQALAEAFTTTVGTDRMQLLRSVVLGWLPWADVDDVSLSSAEGSWEVALRAKVAMFGYGRPEGSDGKVWVLPGIEPVHTVFPNPFAGTLGATYASRGARESDLVIARSIQYHVRRRVELPAGARVLQTPTPLTVRDPRIEAARKSSLEGKVLGDEFTLSLPTGTIAAGRYEDFVGKVHAIDDGFMGGTRVQVKP